MGLKLKFVWGSKRQIKIYHSAVTAVLGLALLFNVGCTGSGFNSDAVSLNSKNASLLSSGAAVSPGTYMGVNINGLADYSSQFFADAMKNGRMWGSAAACYIADPNLQIDVNGWPMGDTSICMLTGQDYIEIGTYSLSFTGQATITTPASPGVTLQNVVYTASTNTTTADVVTTSTSTQITFTFKNTKRLATDTAGTGFTNFKLMRPGQSNQVFSSLLLDRVQSASTLRLMDVLWTNGTLDSTWASRRPPTSAFQKPANTGQNSGVSWEYISLLANTTKKDIWINIPDQATDDYITKLAQLFKYGADSHGNPYTSVQTNPVWAPLNTASKVYIEYSNELWNYMFGQATRNTNRANALAWTAGTAYPQGAYVTNKGNAYICLQAISSATTAPTGTAQSIVDGSGTWAYAFVMPPNLNYDNASNIWYNQYRFTGDRLVRISNIFRSVYGDASMGTQFFPVLASQIANPAVYNVALGYLNTVYGPNNTYGNPSLPINHYIYGLAGAPYWTIGSLQTIGSTAAWPASCTASMATCTSYSTLPGYGTKSYATVNGNLYRVSSPITQSWQAGLTYFDGTTVISGNNVYSVSSTITKSTTAPTGTGTGIADGGGTWAFVKTISPRTAPSGTDSSIADADGTWSYVYTYGDTTAAITQAFIDLNDSVDSYVSAPNSGINYLVATANAYGLVPVGYEGGLDTSLDTNFVTMVCSDAFQNDPRMSQLMLHFYNVWFSAGGKLMNYFGLSGGGGTSGTWGMMTNLENPETGRFMAFVEEATMGSMPALTGGKSLPGTLNLTDMYSPVYTGTATTYTMGANSSGNFEINVSSAGSYLLTTNIYNSAVNLYIDNNFAGNMAVGTGKTLALSLTAGIHSLKITSTAKFGWDPLVISKR